MSAARADIEDGIRAWLVAAGADGGVADPDDAAVIFADQDVARPVLPYLVVKVVVYDIPWGEDEDLWSTNVDSDPTWQGRGQRSATVSVNAYGPTAEAWLERATYMLRSPAMVAQLSTAGLAVRPTGGINNLSALLDDKTQVRFHRDFDVAYERDADTDDIEVLVELEEVVHADTWDSAPTDLVVTVTEVL